MFVILKVKQFIYVVLTFPAQIILSNNGILGNLVVASTDAGLLAIHLPAIQVDVAPVTLTLINHRAASSTALPPIIIAALFFMMFIINY
jgi:hypothetical protein